MNGTKIVFSMGLSFLTSVAIAGPNERLPNYRCTEAKEGQHLELTVTDYVWSGESRLSLSLITPLGPEPILQNTIVSKTPWTERNAEYERIEVSGSNENGRVAQLTLKITPSGEGKLVGSLNILKRVRSEFQYIHADLICERNVPSVK